MRRVCLACKGLGLSPALKREERHPRKSKTAHTGEHPSQKPGIPMPGSICLLAKRKLRYGRSNTQQRKASKPLQGHRCRSVSKPATDASVFPVPHQGLGPALHKAKTALRADEQNGG